MPTTLSLRHAMATPSARYWELLLDREYGRALFLGELGFVRYDVVEQHENPSAALVAPFLPMMTPSPRRTLRVVEAEPRAAGIAKLLGKSLAYQEVGLLDRGNELYAFRTLHPYSRVEGVMHFSGRERLTELHIQVSMPVVGVAVERAMADELRRSYDVSARFTDAWTAKEREEVR
jgi:hypothetical protein